MAYLVAALLTLLALPAFAVTPQPGDLFIKTSEKEISRLDPATGQLELVSCWDPAFTSSPCETYRGTGFADWSLRRGEPFVVGPDGWLYTTGALLFGGPTQIFRIEPETGNREQVTDLAEDLGQEDYLVWPAASFFPSTVASLSSWGLVTLVAGIAIGLQLRMRVPRA